MGAIDADAHVIECPATWDFLDEADKVHTPMIVSQTFGETVVANDLTNVQNNYWVVANRIMAKDRNVGQEMTREIREMDDVDGRLKHMDELGIDVQVIYPTMFLRPVTQNLQTELALCRAYNRWLADRCSRSADRLRWIAMPPLLSMDKVRGEMEWAKENGACGIFMRGLECEKTLGDPYFYPLYEIAGDLDMPVCLHSGSGSVQVHDFFVPDTTFTMFKLAVVGAFHSLIERGIPSRFPNVRWGFVEVSAQWIPYVFCDLKDRFARKGRDWFDDPMKDNNLFVCCEVTDDIDYVVKCAGSDHIMIGTDYGHHDPSAEINAISLIRQDDRLDAATAAKILETNARALYGIH